MDHAPELLAFADAVVTGTAAEIDTTRGRVVDVLSEEAAIDAAALIGNYERMVRIADGTGIPLDTTVAMVSAGFAQEIGITRFATAANTPGLNAIQRGLGALMSRITPIVLALMRAGSRN